MPKETFVPGSKQAYYGDLLYGTKKGSTPYYGGDTIGGRPVPGKITGSAFTNEAALNNAIGKITKGGSVADLSPGEETALVGEMGQMYRSDPHVKNVIDTMQARGGNIGELLNAFALYLRTPRITNPR